RPQQHTLVDNTWWAETHADRSDNGDAFHRRVRDLRNLSIGDLVIWPYSMQREMEPLYWHRIQPRCVERGARALREPVKRCIRLECDVPLELAAAMRPKVRRSCPMVTNEMHRH